MRKRSSWRRSPPRRRTRRAADSFVIPPITRRECWSTMHRASWGESSRRLRNYVMVRSSDSVLDAFMQRGPQRALYDGRLWIRAIKLVADGALGSRGAALLEPYSDDPGNMGLITTPPERIKSVAVRALKAGF